MALFGRNASKMEGSTRKNGSYEAVVGRKEADLAPPSLTLLFTKQALNLHLYQKSVQLTSTVPLEAAQPHAGKWNVPLALPAGVQV